MKALFISLGLFVLTLSTGMAQTEKGRWMVGFSIGSATYQDNNTAKAFSASLSPLAGYFIANNLLIGTGIPLSLSTSKPGQTNPYLEKSVTTGIGLSPFIRYYFGKAALKPYAGISYSYTYMHYVYKPLPLFGSDASGDGYSSTLAPTIGVAYFINRNVALNAGLNYNILKNKAVYFSPTSSTSSRIVDSEIDLKLLSLSLGFQLFFGK